MRRIVALVMFVLTACSVQADDAQPLADKVVVDKSDRELRLLKDGAVLARFPVALGQQPEGHKLEEGDSRTPEGRYYLDARNPNSEFFLSIRVSYPSPADRQDAAGRGVRPGGQIMIHGQPNEPKYSVGFYKSADWTNGCIAVSNAAMIDIWLMTSHNTPIDIQP